MFNLIITTAVHIAMIGCTLWLIKEMFNGGK